MTDIWIPKIGPPQVSDEAKITVLSQVFGEGVLTITGRALGKLQEEHEPLATHLDELGFVLNKISKEGLWPQRVLKIGAALSMLAYRETGYFQSIDADHFELGKYVASLHGIPDAYDSSFLEDTELQALVEAIMETPDFQHNAGGYAQVLSIGAGCVRHYMKHAIAA